MCFEDREINCSNAAYFVESLAFKAEEVYLRPVVSSSDCPSDFVLRALCFHHHILFGACTYVDASTVDGATSKLINGHIKATGALFLEAPETGSKKPAEDGQLIFLTAGLLTIGPRFGGAIDDAARYSKDSYDRYEEGNCVPGIGHRYEASWLLSHFLKVEPNSDFQLQELHWAFLIIA